MGNSVSAAIKPQTTISLQNKTTSFLTKKPLHMSMSSSALPPISGDMSTSEAEWKKRLTAEEYHVIRQKGTERPGTGEYNSFSAPPEGGTFVCRACNAPLYDYKSKFNSGTHDSLRLPSHSLSLSVCVCMCVCVSYAVSHVSPVLSRAGCGWPAFYEDLGTVDRHVDMSMGMKRTEITCRQCGGHLGHVFEGEGFNTPTDERHCVNSLSIKFVKNEP